MGNLVAFRRPAGALRLSADSHHPVTSPKRNMWGQALETSSQAPPRRLSLAPLVRGTAKPETISPLDGYLLVLLADQELTAGRDQQAHTLLDAAYAAFDRQAQIQSDGSTQR